MPPYLPRLVVLTFIVLAGCGTVSQKPAVVKGPARPGKQVAIGPNSSREPPLADPSTMIPPPPNMDLVTDIPDAPGGDEFVSVPDPLPAADRNVVPASGIVSPDAAVRPAVARAAAGPAVPESNLDSLRRLYRQAIERFNAMDGFECRLTRMETVNNKPMPREELHYRFRRQPYSVHITWVGLEAQGRQLIYVDGKYDNKVQILTGKHEGLFVASGKRVAFAPTDSNIRSKARHDIRDGGLMLSLAGFGKVLTVMEQDPSQAGRMRYLGRKPVRERESGLETVEETIPPDWEPLLPKGGKRTTYFDPEPSSPSFGLPILVTTVADNGRQVEYYWFDQLRPTKPIDADFDPDRLWKK
jgi:hypothetical protein